MSCVLGRLACLSWWAKVWRVTIHRTTFLWALTVRVLFRHKGAELETEEGTSKPDGPPRRITYVPIPGPWRRTEQPPLPDLAFQIPIDIPYGTVYYVTKGWRVGRGHTAHVERLQSGHIVKYPISNPYQTQAEEDRRRRMRVEAAAYHRIGHNQYLPKMIDWDPTTCCLTLEYLAEGDLETYMRANSSAITTNIRQQWTIDAAKALAVLHEADVIHCDVVPRNFLLDAALSLHIADFAGSSIAGSTHEVAPGPRYQRPGWSWERKADQADDLFALGSVIYFIMVGVAPYSDVDEDEVERLFGEARFPDVSQLCCGDTIQGCWDGNWSNTGEVFDSLVAAYATTQMV